VFGSSYQPSRAQLRYCLVGCMIAALPYKNKKPSGPYKKSRNAIKSLGRLLELWHRRRRAGRREEPPSLARGAARSAFGRRVSCFARRAHAPRNRWRPLRDAEVRKGGARAARGRLARCSGRTTSCFGGASALEGMGSRGDGGVEIWRWRRRRGRKLEAGANGS
jgi:hypothetical protein